MRFLRNLLKLLTGFFAGYLLTQLGWAFWQIAKADPRFTLLVPANRAPKGVSYEHVDNRFGYTIRHVVEDGIERISYIPEKPHFKTPILFQHGMFHGAWCWEGWQKLFAGWGWENHAISLPGHGMSPTQKPIRECTLDYYLNFLTDEAKRLGHKPVLIGHSMGGALIQWYLKYIAQLPAAVFVASWVAESALLDGAPLLLVQDPAILPLMMRDWDASSWIRTPDLAAKKFLGPRVQVTPKELHDQLDPESALVVLQHNPPFWSHPTDNQTPNLWLAGEKDAVVSLAGLRRSAWLFHGEFVEIPEAGHNLMMEQIHPQIADLIHNWLVSQEIE